MKWRDVSGALRILAGIAVGYYATMCSVPKHVEYRDVVVEVERIKEVERVDTVVTWRERVVMVTPKAETIATAPDAGRPDVDRFCAVVVAAAVPSDSVEAPATPAAPVLLLRSVRHEDAWFLGKDRLILTGPLSNGDLTQRTYRTRPGYQAITHADSLIVQYPRHAVIKQMVEFGAVLGIGYVFGRVVR